MTSIESCHAHRKWSDVCFPERTKQEVLSAAVRDLLHGGPENKCAPRTEPGFRRLPSPAGRAVWPHQSLRVSIGCFPAQSSVLDQQDELLHAASVRVRPFHLDVVPCNRLKVPCADVPNLAVLRVVP